jgi:hypothetical protein
MFASLSDLKPGDTVILRYSTPSIRVIPATPDQIAEGERRKQIKQDQERARKLAVQVSIRARECSNAAAAIPHLEAALAALAED